MRFYNYLTENADKSELIIDLLERDCSKFLKEIKGNFLYRGSKREVDDYKKITSRIDDGRKSLDTIRKVHDVLNNEFNKKFGWKVRNGVFTSFDIYTVKYYGSGYLFFPIGDYKYCYSDEISDLFSYIARKRSIKYPLLELYYLYKEPEKYYMKILPYKYKTDDREEVFDEFTDALNFYHVKYNDINVKKDGFEIIIDEKIKNTFFRYTKHKIGDILIFKRIYEVTYDEFVSDINDEMEEFLGSIALKYTDYNLLKMVNNSHEITFNCKEYYLVDVKYKNIIKGWFKDKGWF